MRRCLKHNLLDRVYVQLRAYVSHETLYNESVCECMQNYNTIWLYVQLTTG